MRSMPDLSMPRREFSLFVGNAMGQQRAMDREMADELAQSAQRQGKRCICNHLTRFSSSERSFDVSGHGLDFYWWTSSLLAGGRPAGLWATTGSRRSATSSATLARNDAHLLEMTHEYSYTC